MDSHFLKLFCAKMKKETIINVSNVIKIRQFHKFTNYIITWSVTHLRRSHAGHYDPITIYTRSPWTLALCSTAAVGMTLAIFCRLLSKTSCCRLNQLKCRVNSHKVPNYVCINLLDHFDQRCLGQAMD